MQINLSNRLAVLAGIGLAAYGIIAFTSRPAEAQVLTYPSVFPRYSELWDYRFANYGQYQSSSGSITGFGLTVSPDNLNRLPVLTELIYDRGAGGHRLTLWREDTDGKYKQVIWTEGSWYQSRPNPIRQFNPGFVLLPGNYVLTYPEATVAETGQLGMIGYWARP